MWTSCLPRHHCGDVPCGDARQADLDPVAPDLEPAARLRAGGAGVPGAGLWADALLNHGRFGGDWRTALAGAGLAVMAAATWWVGTSLTHRGVVVHAVPPRTIPWSEVREIEVENQLGISTVVVHHGVGTAAAARLSAPTTGPLGRDTQFQDKVRVMRTSGPPTATPTRAPPPDPRPPACQGVRCLARHSPRLPLVPRYASAGCGRSPSPSPTSAGRPR